MKQAYQNQRNKKTNQWNNFLKKKMKKKRREDEDEDEENPTELEEKVQQVSPNTPRK
jgi:hypothetical protein